MLRPRLGGLVRRYVTAACVFIIVWTLSCWLILPYDNRLVLWTRFVAQRLSSTSRPFGTQHPPDGAVAFDVDFGNDVAVVLKTGYGTQHRVPAQLGALAPLLEQSKYRNAVIIADFATQLSYNGLRFDIYDVLVNITRDSSLANHKRIVAYKQMSDAISSRNNEEAMKLSKKFGWELDALKFIPGLELAYQQLPNRKWYLLLDDDTYMLQPSARMLLGRLDPTQLTYLGNAVGDFKGRFAHGGSAIILSGVAMNKLFGQRRDLVSNAIRDSLTETWGDRLLALTLMKIGVYLDEQFSHLFNGERPVDTRVRSGRFCAPIMSFHGLADPAQMEEVGNRFRHVNTTVAWGQLWKLYGQQDLTQLEKTTIRENEDHVGRTDDSSMTVKSISSAENCRRICVKHHKTCLAWTWDAETRACHIAPWTIIGGFSPGKFSGLNVRRLQKLALDFYK